MCAIEKITSKTKRIHIATAGGGDPDIIEVPVWNGTVANLTLMALGNQDFAAQHLYKQAFPSLRPFICPYSVNLSSVVLIFIYIDRFYLISCHISCGRT